MNTETQPDHKDWHDRWQEGRIGFHQESYHPALLKYWPDFNLRKDAGVFVPLCGKSLDMIWLAEQGYYVIGVELSAIAARDFFAENRIPCKISATGKFQKYQGGNITIFVGDFFDLTKSHLPNVKAVYDRAAIIALPPELRWKYVAHLRTLLVPGTSILLITLEYDQSKMDGPPFSVPNIELENIFGSWCHITQLHISLPEDFRGIEAVESMYRIEMK